MEGKNFNQKNTAENPQEKLINSLNLKAGQKIELMRVMSSDVGVTLGEVVSKTLKKDLKINEPMFFQDGAETSKVKNVIQKDGKVAIQTATSLYALVQKDRKTKQAEDLIKKLEQKPMKLNAHEIVKEIWKNLNQQPETVKEIFERIKKGDLQEDLFVEAYSIWGKKFLFA